MQAGVAQLAEQLICNYRIKVFNKYYLYFHKLVVNEADISNIGKYIRIVKELLIFWESTNFLLTFFYFMI